MKFVYVPMAEYKIGQILQVQGKLMKVESYAHTGKNLIVTTLEGAPRFERLMCICTDDQPIKGETS